MLRTREVGRMLKDRRESPHEKVEGAKFDQSQPCSMAILRPHGIIVFFKKKNLILIYIFFEFFSHILALATGL